MSSLCNMLGKKTTELKTVKEKIQLNLLNIRGA